MRKLLMALLAFFTINAEGAYAAEWDAAAAISNLDLKPWFDTQSQGYVSDLWFGKNGDVYINVSIPTFTVNGCPYFTCLDSKFFAVSADGELLYTKENYYDVSVENGTIIFQQDMDSPIAKLDRQGQPEVVFPIKDAQMQLFDEDGKVYFSEAKFFNSSIYEHKMNDARLMAMNAKGEILWEYRGDYRVVRRNDDGTIYAAKVTGKDKAYNKIFNMFAINKNGKTLWSTGTIAGNTILIPSRFNAASSTFYTISGKNENGKPTRFVLTAYKSNGKKQWSVPIPHEDFVNVQDNESVTYSDYFKHFDISISPEGKVTKTATPPAKSPAEPIIQGGRFFQSAGEVKTVSTDRRIGALHMSEDVVMKTGVLKFVDLKGQVLWKTDCDRYYISDDKKTVFCVAQLVTDMEPYHNAFDLNAYSIKDGSLIWSHRGIGKVTDFIIDAKGDIWIVNANPTDPIFIHKITGSYHKD